MPDRPINCTPNQFLFRGFRQGDDFAQPLTITLETANGTQPRNLANLTLNYSVPGGLTLPGATVTAVDAANGVVQVSIPANLTALWSGDVSFSLTGTDSQGRKTTLADVSIFVSHYADCFITSGCCGDCTGTGGSAAVGLPVGIANLTTPGLVKPDGVTTTVLLDGTIKVIGGTGGGSGNVTGNYFPLSSNLTVISGEKRIRGVVFYDNFGNGTQHPRDIYGITRNGTESGVNYEYYIGTGYKGSLETVPQPINGATGISVGLTTVNPNATPNFNQIKQNELTINTLGAALTVTSRQDVSVNVAGNVTSAYLGANWNSVLLEKYRSVGSDFFWSAITIYDEFVQIAGHLKAAGVIDANFIMPNSYVTKGFCDQTYMLKTRAN